MAEHQLAGSANPSVHALKLGAFGSRVAGAAQPRRGGSRITEILAARLMFMGVAEPAPRQIDLLPPNGHRQLVAAAVIFV
jgi:hypothetical protein